MSGSVWVVLIEDRTAQRTGGAAQAGVAVPALLKVAWMHLMTVLRIRIAQRE